jgi:hypothetical protein
LKRPGSAPAAVIIASLVVQFLVMMSSTSLNSLSGLIKLGGRSILEDVGISSARHIEASMATHSSISGTASLARVFSFQSPLHRIKTSLSCCDEKSVGVTWTPISLIRSPSLQGM